MVAWLLCRFPPADAAVATAAETAAESPFIVNAWGAGRDKLPQSSVISMIQTRDGYLWLGTVKGLVRFDGTRFEVFNEWNTSWLASSTVIHLFEDRERGLWIGTAAGGATLLRQGRATEIAFDRSGGQGRLTAVAEDETGTVWLYTADGQLCRHRDGQTVFARVGGESLNRTLIAEPAGLVWVGTDERLRGIRPGATFSGQELPLEVDAQVGRLDFLLASRQGGYWQFVNGRVLKCRTNRVERDLGPYPWEGAPIKAACEDREGNLIVGTLNRGVYWYDASGQARQVQGLSHDTALSLCLDHEANLWVGTDGGGLNRVKPKLFQVAEASRGWVVQSVCPDAAGGLWMGFNGGGATYWRGDLVKDFGPEEGLSLIPQLGLQPNFSAVLVDTRQRVWVGTRDAGLFELQDGRFETARASGRIGRNVTAIHEDRAGSLWVGTDAGLSWWSEGRWQTLTTRDGLSSNEITALAEDEEGHFWIGTRRGGLNRRREGRITSFHVRDGLPSENITALLVDREGVLWVGTGNGLGRFQHDHWTRYTKKEGLAGDAISYLLEDDLGGLWIGSNAGLTRAAKQALREFAEGQTGFVPCRAYGVADGLPTEECTQGSQPAACRTPDGRLWFPTIRGLVSVHPSALHPNTNPPPVVVESILVDGREQRTNRWFTPASAAVIIPAGGEQLDIHYTSLNLGAPEQARFRYRMYGHESKWVEAGNSRLARYPKLPPGDYRFEVTACNEDGLWNPAPVSVAVTVLPPFWQTWWFRSASIVGLLSLIIGVVYYVSTQKLQRQLALLRQQEALERERARIARDLHDQLGANLTQVSLLGELVESDKHLPAEVEAHARQISQTAQETSRALDEIVWAANPANDTLDGLVTYACKYAQDYLALAGLRYRLEVPGQLPDAAIAPETRHNVFLAFKEAVNNVVKHAQAGLVHVRLRLGPERFTLEIEDDGRGLPDAAGKTTRNGLRNMRKRMEDVRGEFAIGPAVPRGTLVRLTAPLVKP